MFHLSHHLSTPNSITYSRFNQSHNTSRVPITPPKKVTSFCKNPNILIPRCTSQDTISLSITATHEGRADDDRFTKENEVLELETQEGSKKNFWGAVSLIIGTAVGPGMLGLPTATIRSGSFTSTIAIILCWVYVISSIILVAELSFAAMQEDRVAEVSFTGLATKALGSKFGAFVAVVYASLSFSLLVACVSGIGSIVSQWFPWMNVVLAHALFPVAAGIVIGFFPFKVIDSANRLLCLIMLFSITSLVAIGLSVARTNILASLVPTSLSISAILPAIPVTVLTLGFHVITPFICKIAGNSVSEARKAVLIGGAVPLIMVLSWNLIVLGLAGATTAASSNDPISLLLSINPSALSAVQGFAFSALATSLIGYAVSFPRQLLDTLGLIFTKTKSEKQIHTQCQIFANGERTGRIGFVTFSRRHNLGSSGRASFDGTRCFAASEVKPPSSTAESDAFHHKFVMIFVLGVPILIGSFFRSTFSRALDFAGVYANCFLFGILPPVMAYVQQSRKKLRSSILPGGDITLLLLFSIAVILGIWH
ncbi:TRYPTOPHAN/TYROSINE PERMEASE [Salix purpurea]|uniref:TRYPTOPHAN/TYROSINE PERMEASE n=1 Tax=Salix purpurea TaxID=77065 RepID=A0A9Q0V8Q3_SALPP|nr:TRYPTOPHAN/TYROSINE PERMEASE [Salix purpurea]